MILPFWYRKKGNSSPFVKFSALRICEIYNIDNLFTQAPAEDVKL